MSLNKFETELDTSLKFGFINLEKYKSDLYAPKILLNDAENGQHVLTDLTHELRNADSFQFMTAFVTYTGIGMLKADLHDFATRGGQGKMIVSPYLGFNDPIALKELLKLKNVEVRITPEESSMHAKIYLFEQAEQKVCIAGSSNLTESALKVNYEWNVKLTSAEHGDFIRQTQNEYDKIWAQSRVLTEELIEEYAQSRQRIQSVFKKENQIRENIESYHIEGDIQPNQMQKEAVASLADLRQKGAKRALVVSATGTGKTYLAAFDVKNANPDKMLFVVHREQILKNAQESFQEVIGFSDDETTIYRSGDDVSDKRFVFATIQTLSREENLSHLPADLFDYILIDEAHHVGAQSYQNVIDHFDPGFLVGLTATPERTDTINIYEIFDFNVAYEIRLQEALDQDMLCPFIYYGVPDNYDVDLWVDDETELADLTSESRVRYIIEKMNYYEVSGLPTKGLIFCSRNKEAAALSEKLNEMGKRTVHLSGEDSQDYRREVVEKLEKGEIEYILTVDIFNEGIDIPSINQVVMLRNTQSSIVFIQQLGRGLRKHESKEHVTIIDFIGNYKNNYLIPIALYGDQSLKNENYRRKLSPQYQIDGITTVTFEEIAREEVFKSIDRTNFSVLTVLKESYVHLKQKIGRIPLLADFIEHATTDPTVFFENAFRNEHYGRVIEKFEKLDHSLIGNDYANKILSFITNELLNGKRPHELILLKELFTVGRVSKQTYLDKLDEAGAEYTDKIIESVENVLTLSFFKEDVREKYGDQLLILAGDFYEIDSHLYRLLTEEIWYKRLFNDVVKAGLLLSKNYPGGYTKDQLSFGQSYSRKDAARLLLWDQDESSTMYGYRVKHGTCPIFVNYHKDEAAILYNDHFINQERFHWYTRTNRTFESREVQQILQSNQNGIDLHLFIQKDNSKDKKIDFFYVGQAHYIEETASEITMARAKGTEEEPVVTMDLKLEEKVPYELYEYFTEK